MMAQNPTADKMAMLSAALDDLRAFVMSQAQAGATFHDFEEGLWQRMLRMGHSAVDHFLTAHGTGDLGESFPLPNGGPLRRLEQLHRRDLTCVFGTFTLARTCYGTREGQKIAFVPLDARLALPEAKSSYLLQDWDLLMSTDQPFAPALDVLERILGLRQHVDSVERLSKQAAQQVEPFHQSLPTPPADEEGEVFVQSTDGKGVPMRRPADAPPVANHDRKRGPKKDRKRQAIVGTVYSVDRHVRSPEEVVEALFRQAGEEKLPITPRPRPCHKRVRVRLNAYTDEQGLAHEGLAEVCWWMAEQMRDRNPGWAREVVNLMDGEERLWEAQALFHPAGARPTIDVLDLLHVTPRLWQAARLFHPPDSDEALAMVRDRTLRVLRGEVASVVRGLRQMGSKRGLKGAKAKELATICNYLEKNQDRMRYDEYLKAGYPIASGVIEGACRHYVKDRMERTGMSWVPAGAQAMLELRATALNGDWDHFVSFRIQQETLRLHPLRSLLEDVSWPLAV